METPTPLDRVEDLYAHYVRSFHDAQTAATLVLAVIMENFRQDCAATMKEAILELRGIKDNLIEAL